MAVSRKIEFDRARANHEAVLGLETTHGRDADNASDLPRDCLVGRIGKAELGSGCAAALADVGHLHALRRQSAGEFLGLRRASALFFR